ncbi:MAG: hypothetical protein ACR2IB_03475 [Pyrinomonadaceae bacterium]
MSKKTVTESEYHQIMREACEKPFGPDVIAIGMERDYLYAVWRGLATHLEWELPMLPGNGRTEVELLREEIIKLVTAHQPANYPIWPPLNEHISAALGRSSGP